MSRWRTPLLWSFLALLLLSLSFVALLPTLLSTEWGTEKFLSWFNHTAKGQLSLKEMHLSWLGKQHLEGLHYADAEGKTLLSIKKLESDNSLLYLLCGGKKLRTTLLEEPYYAWHATTLETTTSNPFSRWLGGFFHFNNQLQVENGTFFLLSPLVSPIKIANLQITTHDANQYQIHATTMQGDLVGSIDLECSQGDTLVCSGKISQFPLALFDELTHSSWYTDLLGKNIDITFAFTRKTEKSLSFSAQVTSEQVQGTFQGEVRNQILYLDTPNHLSLTVKPKLLANLIPEREREAWTMASPATLSLDILKGIFPLSLTPSYYQKMVVQAEGALERIELHHTALGSYSLHHVTFGFSAQKKLELTYQGTIQGKETSDLSGMLSLDEKEALTFNARSHGFPLHLLSLFSPSLTEPLSAFLGTSFDTEWVGMYQNKELNAKLHLLSPEVTLDASLLGEIDHPHFEITGKKNLSGRAKEECGETLLFHATGLCALFSEKPMRSLVDAELSTPLGSVEIHGSLDPSSKKQKEAHFLVTAKGMLNTFPSFLLIPAGRVEEGSFSLSLEGSLEKIFGQAECEIALKTESGVYHKTTLTTQGTLTHYIQEGALHIADAILTFHAHSPHLPLELIGSWIPEGLSPLLGKEIEVDLEGGFCPQQKWRLGVKAENEMVQLKGALLLDPDTGIKGESPLSLQWKMTPEHYLHLMTWLHPEEKPKLRLIKPALCTLSVTQFFTPFSQEHSWFCQAGCSAKMTLSPLSFRDYEKQTYFVLNDFIASLEGKELAHSVDLHLSGSMLAQNIPRSEASRFSFTGNLTEVCTSGRWKPENASLTGALHVDLLPVQPITDLLIPDETTRTLVQSVLGEFVHTHISGSISHFSGHALIDISGSNLKATLPIRIAPHALYLDKRVEAEITLTDAVNDTLLKDVNPIITGAHSDHPIKLTIEPEGFLLPIRPYTLSAVEVGKATLDVGKVSVEHGEQLQLLTTFLKTENESPGSLQAWFTPIFFKIHQGVATYERFDILLGEHMHVAFWGSVNLLNQKVRMILGIDPKTLEKYLNISGLGKQDLFQVKMRGTTTKLELDWSSAYTRIAVLMAKKSKNAVGAIVGEILSQISTSLGDEPPPPPTTDPLPWDPSPLSSKETFLSRLRMSLSG